MLLLEKSGKIPHVNLFYESLTLPSQYLLTQSEQWKYHNNGWNMFQFNNKHTTNDANYVVLMSLLLTLNKFHTLFCCFHCWIWTSTCQLGTKLLNAKIDYSPANIYLLKVNHRNTIKRCEICSKLITKIQEGHH